MKEWSFWSNWWNELMFSFYKTCTEHLHKWLIFLFNTLSWNIQTSEQYPNWTSMKISLGLSFVLESHNLTTLLKQKILYQLFYINLKCVCSQDNVLSMCTLNSFCLLNSQILASPIFAQILSCLYPPTSKWHLPSFSFI